LGKNLSPSASLVNKYAKVNTDRKGKQDARERRRYGDWDILEIPTALLWLDAACAVTALEGDPECPMLPLLDLWP
jgi:hypothetical protein